MAIFYLLTIFASLPILAYVLSQRTSYKGIVFATTVFVLIGCLILFVSKFAILGSVNKQVLTNNISNQIYIDEKKTVYRNSWKPHLLFSKRMNFRILLGDSSRVFRALENSLPEAQR